MTLEQDKHFSEKLQNVSSEDIKVKDNTTLIKNEDNFNLIANSYLLIFLVWKDCWRIRFRAS